MKKETLGRTSVEGLCFYIYIDIDLMEQKGKRSKKQRKKKTVETIKRCVNNKNYTVIFNKEATFKMHSSSTTRSGGPIHSQMVKRI
jgi:hypothetical protein